MVGRNKRVNRFNVSPIFLTCDNTVNTIPALCLANAAGSPDQCQVLRNRIIGKLAGGGRSYNMRLPILIRIADTKRSSR